MNWLLGTTLLVTLASCSAKRSSNEALNRWADDRLWPVLEAQDRRDVPGLCTFLKDPSTVVREAAALALASIQDEVATGCLLEALADSTVAVRAAAAFALGHVADSAAVQQLAEAAMNERDIAVQRAYLGAAFIAMQRNGLLKDANAILYYLDRAEGHERVRAADALRRLPDSLVQKAVPEITELMASEGTEVRQFLLLAMKKFGAQAVPALIGGIAESNSLSNERISALRAYAALYPDESSEELLFTAGKNAAETWAALDLLQGRQHVDGRQCLSNEAQRSDTAVRIALLGMAIRHGDDSSAKVASARLDPIATAVRSPYLKAAVINASTDMPSETLFAILRSDAPAIERQAAFQGLVTTSRAVMMRSRFASREAQYAQLGEVVSAAIATGDAGLISAAAELVQEEEADVIRLLFPPSMEKAAFAPLQPIRDLEARLLLENVIAKRDGLPKANPKRPAFNHPIDRSRLLALKQGQRYRIATNKGEIVIATDVNECPGSSLAFDSLVTAGYYNGKAFHRMVPNFVVQGGCPRGDGYGGMPWTLRTEIGRTPFTAGSVGLASAGPDTESCQFFITHSAAPHLDGRYTRFGEVVSGMNVVWELQVGDVMQRVERVE